MSINSYNLSSASDVVHEDDKAQGFLKINLSQGHQSTITH